MSKQIDALKLALECAERCESIDGMYSWADTITAIKEALAQPEQEQIDISELCATHNKIGYKHGYRAGKADAQSKEPEQEPVATLDDLEQEIYENTRQFVSRDFMEWMLKRYYTTPPQPKKPEQEPVAYFNPQVKGGFYWAKPTKITAPVSVNVEPMPLYTTPPQRKPLDMTEIVQLTYDIDEDKPATMAELFRFARAIEAAHGIKE